MMAVRSGSLPCVRLLTDIDRSPLLALLFHKPLSGNTPLARARPLSLSSSL